MAEDTPDDEGREPEDVELTDSEPSDDWPDGGEGQFIQWPRDPRLDPAKADLAEWFKRNPTGVFYGRQIEVIFEKQYFHWITHKALKELTNESNALIESEIRTTEGGNKLRIYWSKRNRYYRRAAQELVRQVDAHSIPDITKAIGHHAETLFGFAAAREGFAVDGPAIRAYQGKEWPLTEHDLDWIFSRDGVGWGVEIKNTWAYIDKQEMEIKIQMCLHLGIKPLFIMRWAPKSYIEIIRQAGGFGLVFESQYFPIGHTDAVEQLKALSLPVISPMIVPPGVFRRFAKWHEGGLGR